jgi:hypothetical protein
MLVFIGCADNLTTPPERDGYQGPQNQTLVCLPDLDGVITAHELQAAIDVPVNYRISPAGVHRPIDLVGQIDDADIRVWDWSHDDVDDERLTITAKALGDQWYAGEFPDGEFVTPLDAAGTLDAVYRQTSDAVLLLGYASAAPEPRTRVVYEAPVTVLQLPLQRGDAWVSIGVVRNARIAGLPYAGRDIYQVEVDAEGEVWLPDLRFEKTLRVRTALTIEPAVGEPVRRRQVSFFFECFGEVARAVSLDGAEEAFSSAGEVRRLGL